MLLDDGEEMGNAALFRQDDGLAQQCAAFGSADIENITEPGQIRQGQFIGRTGQRIGQPGTIQIERDMMSLADIMDVCQFLFRIQRAIFGRMGQVDHARHNHMIVVGIGCEIVQESCNLFGRDLAELVWQL